MMACKHVVNYTAKKHGKSATFLPKPLFAGIGPGLRARQSLSKKGKPLFPGKEYAGLSRMALYYDV